MAPAVGQTIRVRVEELTPEWQGLGKIDGVPVRLDGTVWPGDEAEAVLTARSRQHGHWFARVRRVISSAVPREPSFCELASACGGCRGSGIPYEAQTAWKAAYLQSLFPQAGFTASPRALGYRGKVKWIVGRGRDGRVQPGFYRPGSHKFLPITHCPLLAPALAQLEESLPLLLQDVEPYDEATDAGFLKAVFARTNSAGEILVSFVASREPNAAQAEILRAASRISGVAGVTCNLQPARTNRLAGDTERVIWGADCLVETDWPQPLRFNATGFSQANHDVAKAAVECIAAGLRGVKSPVIDLYCGTGPIALALDAQGHAVMGVEVQVMAVELARRSSSRIGWHCMDAGAFLADFRPDSSVALVANPPRTGLLNAVTRRLGELPIGHFAYMSCNPQTLARDAAVLKECGFRLESVKGFDMFPQTPWFETVAHFTR